MKPDEGKTMGIGALIPQIFYDCIARLIPGLTIMGTVALFWWAELASHRGALARYFADAPFWTGIAILLCAYVIALILEGLRHFQPVRLIRSLGKGATCGFPSKREIMESNKMEQFWCDCAQNYKSAFGISPEEKIPRVSRAIAIDLVRLENPDSGSRIVKLKAELALLNTLRYGWLLVSAIYIGFLVYRQSLSSEAMIKIGLLPCATGCIVFRYKDLEKKYLCALYNHWLIIGSRFKIKHHIGEPDIARQSEADAHGTKSEEDSCQAKT